MGNPDQERLDAKAKEDLKSKQADRKARKEAKKKLKLLKKQSPKHKKKGQGTKGPR